MSMQRKFNEKPYPFLLQWIRFQIIYSFCYKLLSNNLSTPVIDTPKLNNIGIS